LDLSVLEELRFSHRPLRPKEIGDALGVSYQLITRRSAQLCDRGYVDYARGRPVTISEKGRNDIFGKAG
jgi:Mn-dependent DtxR family transcriptional regulator